MVPGLESPERILISQLISDLTKLCLKICACLYDRHFFYVIGKCVLLHKKRSAMDAHLAEMKFIASQYRSGAKESLATLCS